MVKPKDSKSTREPVHSTGDSAFSDLRALGKGLKNDREQFLERAQRLIERLASGQLPQEVADDAPYVMERLEAMIQQVRDDTLPPRGERQITLTRLTNDHWPFRGIALELGNEVAEVEALYAEL